MSYRMPTDLARYVDVRSDEAERFHFRLDRQASVIDAYGVALPPYVCEPGLVVSSLREAITTLRSLRSQPFVPLYPASVFVPYGVIVATSLETVSRDVAIRLAMIEGGTDLTDADRERISQYPELHEHGDAQMRRIAALYRAQALLNGVPLPDGTMDGWRGLKVSH